MKRITLYQDLKLKNGTVYPKGTPGHIRPATKADFPSIDKIQAMTDPRELELALCRHCVLEIMGQRYTVRYTSVVKPPSLKSLERTLFDSVAKTVGGYQVEPDGFDSRGFPAWPLVLGFV